MPRPKRSRSPEADAAKWAKAVPSCRAAERPRDSLIAVVPRARCRRLGMAERTSRTGCSGADLVARHHVFLGANPAAIPMRRT